ncbi:hypothetical protein LAV84_18475 [Rhizobium sp. VS19-DR104.2]|uniref:DUF6197 family protein n=1 Tax=unclassified Rhizobium TaxID=2613769 RepID=UPI001CC46690|nr:MULTISPECIES: hypothetical protein [unclassified Rhizobium]MBZ5761547.1 hypothetical protein [Rhizobium sp. VS19-DR96]MBZ5767495.1 hypothetical protein [Rhizobium sp. VS19-DR129.2]MBZ5775056.1 hypothetical protein [Rhizobium sp. VS19-DRK62.2]MBZ5785979.1 hypothetical protein [Rhizobium sp. VS19-DR121]MBZ5803405.1 hypothetical protein [Rhizobium sp. VS19-DR181]
MSAALAIQDALSLIDAPHKWAKEAIALDGAGNEVKPLSDKAKRFCMIGALQRVQCSTRDYGQAVRLIRKECGKQSIFEFNDNHGHKAVKSLMKRAIRAAETA